MPSRPPPGWRGWASRRGLRDAAFRLEFAGYCLTIFETPALEECVPKPPHWYRRNEGTKESFQDWPRPNSIGQNDTKLANIFDLLYQRSIDFGGHPNPHASRRRGLGRTWHRDQHDGPRDQQRPDDIAHALKSTAQVGLRRFASFSTSLKGSSSYSVSGRRSTRSRTRECSDRSYFCRLTTPWSSQIRRSPRSLTAFSKYPIRAEHERARRWRRRRLG